jgi:dihydrodipicolinate synthase/N-acetylneuraminate lyase
MRSREITPEDLRGVFAVPPLARKSDGRRSLAFDQNELIAQHLKRAGISRLIYGGNAFLYHLTLTEFSQLIEWLSSLDDNVWAIPSVGPDFGRAIDQAELLKSYRFPCAMVLPCSDPRDAAGLETGLREIAETAATRLILYLKDETNFGTDKAAGLDVVGRLVDERICVAIKYAVVREDPCNDPYLDDLLRQVDRRFVISGIGERPAVIHLRDWGLPGFTTGSGCLAPHLSQKLFEACVRADRDEAERLRAEFIPLEDLRDCWHPARVLHAAIESAGLAMTGPMPPYLSALSSAQLEQLAPVARRLFQSNSTSAQPVAEASARS